MKKFIKSVTVLTMFSLVLSTVSMVGATTNVNTGLNRDLGSGFEPIIKAKWEMDGPYANLGGDDASTAAGAQFNAPGVWGANKTISFCAVVTDPDGIDDINAVYADFYYPSDRAFHPESSTYPDQVNGGTNALPDYGESGCGFQVGDEIALHKLTKTQGLELFCNQVKNGNSNLPTFYGSYEYNEIGDGDGELQKETAYVYCGDRNIIWEDPAGLYRVKVFALDNAGLFSDDAINTFEYLPLTSFQVDFASVSYGNVKLGVHKVISGDLTFDLLLLSDKPTVRNLGNTRLQMSVWQDDMGFGTTDGLPNVRYDGRLGNNEADWKNYNPSTTTWLQDLLDLSQVEELDFSILVKKFPSSEINWDGVMTLGARFANFRQCEPPTTPE